VSVEYGETARLTATVTTTPDSPPVTSGAWQKQISGAYISINLSDQKYAGSTNDISGPVLQINSAVYTDNTAYRFTASNLVGLTFSSPRTLNVTGSKYFSVKEILKLIFAYMINHKMKILSKLYLYIFMHS
jgi:hypothetical protein